MTFKIPPYVGMTGFVLRFSAKLMVIRNQEKQNHPCFITQTVLSKRGDKQNRQRCQPGDIMRNAALKNLGYETAALRAHQNQ